MTALDTLISRNQTFAAEHFVPGQSINPSANVMVIACVDPRVDPTHVLGLENGEAAVIRNVGGRITPATLHSMQLLSRVGQANPEGKQPGAWNLVVLHHTDCGMTDLAAFPDLLAEHFAIPVDELEAKAVSDPHASVRVDVDVIQQAIRADDFFVTGLVYDVETGLVETVVPAAPVPGPAT